MTNEQTTDNGKLKRTIRRLRIFNALLILLLLGGIALIAIVKIPGAAKPPFVGVVDDGRAADEIREFSQGAALSPFADDRGVFFSDTAIRSYLDGEYRNILARHKQHAGTNITADMEWKLGFYWKYGPGSNRTGLSYFVIPVLYDRAAGKVLDYFDPANSKYYKKGDGIYNVYNEGHLWP